MDTIKHRAPTSSNTNNSDPDWFSQQQSDLTKINTSRRSIDWRDSGIVIDVEDHLFEQLCNFEHQPEAQHQADRDSQKLINDKQIILATNQATTASATVTTTTSYPSRTANPSQADEDGDTILHLAVVGSTLDKVRDLMNLCDLNAINNMMQTPMHVAVLANRPEMVRLLIESGARVSIHDRQGNTPLHLASQRGLIEIVEMLLCAIVENKLGEHISLQTMIETCNFDGFTCLHLAATNDRRNIIQLLVEKYKANLNHKDGKSGETIMHKAVRQLNVDLVAFILNLFEHQHCNGTDFAGRKPLNTIDILQDAHAKDIDHRMKLAKMKELIEDGVRRCIVEGGCCSDKRPDKLCESLDNSDCSSSNSEACDSEFDYEMD